MTAWTATVCQGDKCGAKIAFLKTATGKMIPVDIDANLKSEDTHFVHGRHTPHHSVCPNAGQFRRKR